MAKSTMDLRAGLLDFMARMSMRATCAKEEGFVVLAHSSMRRRGLLTDPIDRVHMDLIAKTWTQRRAK